MFGPRRRPQPAGCYTGIPPRGDLEVAAAAVDGKMPHVNGIGEQAGEHAFPASNFPVNEDFSGVRVSISARKSPSMTAGQGLVAFKNPVGGFFLQVAGKTDRHAGRHACGQSSVARETAVGEAESVESCQSCGETVNPQRASTPPAVFIPTRESQRSGTGPGDVDVGEIHRRLHLQVLRGWAASCSANQWPPAPWIRRCAR
jgi:hypothetical protein